MIYSPAVVDARRGISALCVEVSTFHQREEVGQQPAVLFVCGSGDVGILGGSDIFLQSGDGPIEGKFSPWSYAWVVGRQHLDDHNADW
jgi:hypothetical protein